MSFRPAGRAGSGSREAGPAGLVVLARLVALARLAVKAAGLAVKAAGLAGKGGGPG